MTGSADRLVGVTEPRVPDAAALHVELVGDEGLTAQASTFTRRDVLEAIATRLPAGADVTDIETLADTMLTHDREQIVQLDDAVPRTSGDVIRLADGTTVEAAGGEPRYTIRSLFQTESAAAEAAARRTTDRLGIVDRECKKQRCN